MRKYKIYEKVEERKTCKKMIGKFFIQQNFFIFKLCMKY